jgi:hypothetical protein
LFRHLKTVPGLGARTFSRIFSLSVLDLFSITHAKPPCVRGHSGCHELRGSVGASFPSHTRPNTQPVSAHNNVPVMCFAQSESELALASRAAARPGCKHHGVRVVLASEGCSC